MGVFEKMLTDEYRTSFIVRWENKLSLDDEYQAELALYIRSDECINDIKRLMSGDYFFTAPHQHMVRKNHSTERRKVYSFRGKEKFLLRYMAFVLMDFDHVHADSVCSFRNTNRTRAFFHKYRKIDPKRQLYSMQTDIHDCGGSVDQDVLIEIITPLFSDDPAFLAFLNWLLKRNVYIRGGKPVKERVSIIEGLPMGPFFQNLYMAEIDRALEPMSTMYIRYTDDIGFFADSYDKAREALEVVRKLIVPLKFTLNEKKTIISGPGEDVELLGIEMYPGGYDIGENSLRKLMAKLKRKRDRILRRLRKGRYPKELALLEMIHFYDRTFFGMKIDDHEFNWVVHAFPIITRIDGLKRLDAYAQDCIRVAGSGKLGNAKYRISYKQMKKAGYRSLVSAYYHGYSLEERTKHENSADNADSIVR